MTQVEVPRSTRLLSLTAVLAGATVEGLVLRGGARRRQRLQLCTAARVLTALGALVRVVPPPVPWPRAGGLLVSGHDAGRLGDLAVLTSVPRAVAGWAELADRALPFPGAGVPTPGAGRPPAPVLCPVTVACRTADGPLQRLPRRVEEVAALRGLEFEVRLLQPIAADPVGQLGGAGSSSTGGTAGTGGRSGSAGTAVGLGVVKDV